MILLLKRTILIFVKWFKYNDTLIFLSETLKFNLSKQLDFTYIFALSLLKFCPKFQQLLYFCEYFSIILNIFGLPNIFYFFTDFGKFLIFYGKNLQTFFFAIYKRDPKKKRKWSNIISTRVRKVMRKRSILICTYLECFWPQAATQAFCFEQQRVETYDSFALGKRGF